MSAARHGHFLTRSGFAAAALLAASVAARAADLQPQLVGEGVISTPDDEFGGQFSADGKTLWFNKSVPRSQLYTIFTSTQSNNVWSAPQVAAFSGIWRDYDATLSADGKRLYFISDRPRSDGKPHAGYAIWYLQSTAAGWREPVDAGAPLNGDWSSHFAVATRDGTLYFTSDRPGGKGYLDVWRARMRDGRYAEPENLGDAINAAKWANYEVWVAPDESYLIVSAYGHDDSLGDCDLYVSYSRDGVFGPLQNLGAPVNSAARDYSARVTPDGKTLIFSSERGLPTDVRATPWTYGEFTDAIHGVRNGLGNIYRIDLATALAHKHP